MELKIRAARPEDVDNITRIAKTVRLKQIAGFHWHTKATTKRVVKMGFYFVGEAEGRIVAIIWLRPGVENSLVIDNLAVDPAKRRLGIAKALMGFAATCAREAGYKLLVVLSFYEYGLKDFYKKMGFRLQRKPGIWADGHKYHVFYKYV